jgi:hypothetical protein
MLTATQRREIQLANSDLDAVALQQLFDYVDSLSFADKAAYLDGVLGALPGIVTEFGDVSALLASQAYELAREQAEARGRFVVDLSAPPAAKQVEASARWALSPMFAPDSAMDDKLLERIVKERLSSSVQRLVREGGRRTMVDNSMRDPAKPRYRRVLSSSKSSHCDFCKMLAGRGYVYHTKDTAGAGKHWHDRCGCELELGFHA